MMKQCKMQSAKFKKGKILFLFAFFILNFAFASMAQAKTVYTQTLDQPTVQAIINGTAYGWSAPSGGTQYSGSNTVAEGDQVILPAGSSNWSNPLVITTNLSLIGAGMDQTILIGDNLIRMTLQNDKVTARLSSIQFHNIGDPDLASVVSVHGTATVKIDPITGAASGGLRVDHCKWTNEITNTATKRYRFVLGGFITGVFDHNIIDTDPNNIIPSVYNNEIVDISHTTAPDGTGSTGHPSWNHDYIYGGGPTANGDWDAFYLEDNIFHALGAVTDSLLGGGRRVLRHNTANAHLGSHGTESGGNSGTRASEYYNNKWVRPPIRPAVSPTTAIGIRGGGAVFFNNWWGNFPNPIQWMEYRASGNNSILGYPVEAGPHFRFGYSDGGNPWDLNERGVVNGISPETPLPSDPRIGAIYAHGTGASTDRSVLPPTITLTGLNSPTANCWTDFVLVKVDTNGFHVDGSTGMALIIGNAAGSNTVSIVPGMTPKYFGPTDHWIIRKVKTYAEVIGSGKEDQLLIQDGPNNNKVPTLAPGDVVFGQWPASAHFVNSTTDGVWLWNNQLSISPSAPFTPAPPYDPTAISWTGTVLRVTRGFHNAVLSIANGGNHDYPWNPAIAGGPSNPATRVGADWDDTPAAGITTQWAGPPIYQTGVGGYVYPHPLVTGMAPIGTPSSLPAPTLNLPSILPVNADITAGYPSGYNVSTVWSFSQTANLASSVHAAGAPAAVVGGVTSYSASGLTAHLSQVQLTPGVYTISVYAVDSNNNQSPSATASVTLVPGDLSGVRVFPNPWRSDKHSGLPITFDTLSVNSTIKLFTVSGHWIKTLPTSSTSVTWDLTNDSGSKVASGLYVYLIKDDQGQKKTGQVAVIK
jgi:hypothetical protein